MANLIASLASDNPIKLPRDGPIDEREFRLAMRQLAGGVSLVTIGKAPHRTGFTATSVSSLSVTPPRMIVSINRASSSYPALERCRCFGISILARHHAHVAARFAGSGGVKGEQRFVGHCWHSVVTGASLLCDALATIDCELEEIIERHSHAIVIGRAVATRSNNVGGALTYWRGNYRDVTHPEDESAAGQWGPIIGTSNIGCG